MEQRGPPQWRSEGDRRAAGIFGSPRASGIDYNHAEVIMAQGRLEEAAELYERAVAEAERSHDPYQLSTQILARWGLAAAQDRLGHHALALETAKKAIRLDEMPMSLLHADGVFFIPSYERHYYEGLGYMALATMRQDGVERLEAYEQAAKRWRTFLERGGAASPWASVARMHLRRVREALAGLPPRR
jgi:tetratricopeptide (TPR) repeat protein